MWLNKVIDVVKCEVLWDELDEILDFGSHVDMENMKLKLNW